jgi:hypothetical protein
VTRTSIRLLALVLAVMIPLTGAAAGQEPDPQAGALARLAPFGVQQDPSKQLPTDEQVAGEAPLPGVNPFLATPPAGQPADLAFYRELLRRRRGRDGAGGRPRLGHRAVPDRPGG